MGRQPEACALIKAICSHWKLYWNPAIRVCFILLQMNNCLLKDCCEEGLKMEEVYNDIPSSPQMFQKAMVFFFKKNLISPALTAPQSKSPYLLNSMFTVNELHQDFHTKPVVVAEGRCIDISPSLLLSNKTDWQLFWKSLFLKHLWEICRQTRPVVFFHPMALQSSLSSMYKTAVPTYWLVAAINFWSKTSVTTAHLTWKALMILSLLLGAVVKFLWVTVTSIYLLKIHRHIFIVNKVYRQI